MNAEYCSNHPVYINIGLFSQENIWFINILVQKMWFKTSGLKMYTIIVDQSWLAQS